MAGLYTVVIPTYNRRETLLQVLQAIGRQDAPSLLESVIVVDDGSSDGTEQAVNKCRFDFPLQLVTGRKGGPAAARNAGIEAAGGNYILFLCDDIEPTPQWLRQHHLRRAKANFDHCVVGRVVWPPGARVTSFMRFVDRNYHFGFEKLEGRRELEFADFITSNLSIEKRLLVDHGGFDARFPYGFEDTDMGLRLTRAGMRVLYAPDALAYHHHDINLQSYSRRQENVGESALVFARKHPEQTQVTRLDRLPKPWTPRWLAKTLLMNPVTRPLVAGLATGLDTVGLPQVSAPLYFQLLSYHYYRGVRRALARERVT